MREFTIQDAGALAGSLKSRGVMAEAKAGELSVGLNEIRDSADETFQVLLSKLIHELETGSSVAADTVSAIRQERSHIHYQVKDCKLPPDQDPWREVLPKD